MVKRIALVLKKTARLLSILTKRFTSWLDPLGDDQQPQRGQQRTALEIQRSARQLQVDDSKLGYLLGTPSLVGARVADKSRGELA